MDPTARSWHVQWHVDGETIRRDVTVSVAEGQVVDIQSGCAAGAVDLGPVALIPGLVNTHTHLEFSLLREPIPTAGRFTDWIRRVVQFRRDHPEQTSHSIRRGIAECHRSGTTLIGDIATTSWQGSDYFGADFDGIVFQELLGLGDDRVASQCELARTTAVRQTEGSVQFGLSPHAPYSTHPELFRTAIQHCLPATRPVAMHLAETRSELELLTEGTGEFREMLTELGIWRDGLFGGHTVREYLEALATAPRALVVHGNYLTDEDLEFMATQPNMTLVYCPRTHTAFGHHDHPWRRLRHLGGSVAIGTDSRASNPDLNLFSELQFLAARHADVSHLELLLLGTQAGRKALLGRMADQDRADFCVVGLDQPDRDPAHTLFAARNRVVGTIIGGKWIDA